LFNNFEDTINRMLNTTNPYLDHWNRMLARLKIQISELFIYSDPINCSAHTLPKIDQVNKNMSIIPPVINTNHDQMRDLVSTLYLSLLYGII
jgi:hypothetical protein